MAFWDRRGEVDAFAQYLVQLEHRDILIVDVFAAPHKSTDLRRLPRLVQIAKNLEHSARTESTVGISKLLNCSYLGAFQGHWMHGLSFQSDKLPSLPLGGVSAKRFGQRSHRDLILLAQYG